MTRSVFRVTRDVSLLLMCLLAVSMGGLSALAATNDTVTPLITQRIDESRRVVLGGNMYPLAIARYDIGEAAKSTPSGRVQLVLGRSKAQQQALTQYLSDVQNPGSAAYHRWLTPSEFGAKFGIADSDLDAVEGWLQSHGLKVDRVAQARNVIEFSGSFAQIEASFSTSIHTFRVNGVDHIANATNPQIPAALSGVVKGVGPLNDFHPASQAQFGSKAHFDTSKKQIQPDLTLFDTAGNPILYVDPADAATIYDTPNALLNKNYTGTTYDGTGINIGIVGDSNFTMQDVLNYRVAFLGETSVNANLPTVIIDGASDPGINGDEGEALLDNEISGGIAPKAKLYFYTAANSDLQSGVFDAFVRALDDNTVSILNMSFGECEAGLGVSGNQFLLEIMEQAASQGISVTVSTGDAGSAGCDSTAEPSAQFGLMVSGLASTPYNIAVGGTDFPALSQNFATYALSTTSGTAPYYDTALSYIPETPWNDSTGSNGDLADNFPYVLSSGSTDVIAGGGGLSGCVNSSTDANDNVTCISGYPKPAFQSALTSTDGVRDIPDVSFLAANGLYDATWVVCSDNVADGSVTAYTDCELTDGAFGSNTYFSGYGGTSAAAPAMAGFLALVEQKTGSRLGQADYVLYQLASQKYSTVFHDVTTGNNSVYCATGAADCGGNNFLTGYNAGTGYDYASGLGSIDVAQMVNNWDTVGLAATTTNLTINGAPAPITAVHGTSLTFGAAVSPNAATGSVGIVDNANESSTVQNNGQTMIPLSGGNGSTAYNGLPGGSYTVSGFYSGDTANAASTSDGIPVTITAEDGQVALTVNVYQGDGTPLTNLAAAPYGSIYQITGQVQGKAEGANSTGIATGAISFTDNSATLASDVTLNSANMAQIEAPTGTNTTVFPIGAHSFSASYAGDASYKAATATPVPVTIVQATTAIEMKASNANITTESAALLTIAADGKGFGVAPTGTIVLSANGATLQTFPSLSPGGGAIGVAGVVTYSLQGTALKVGANTVTATYGGDTNYTAATGQIVIAVAQAGFALSNGGAISVAGGATSGNTSTVTATPSNGFTGVINLSCAVTTSIASPASAPTCSLPATVDVTTTSSVGTTLSVATTTSTTPGSYSVTVTGVDGTTGKITTTTSIPLTVTGTAIPASFSLSNGGNLTLAPGATTGNTATITATPAGGFTGAINLSCAVTTSIASTVSAPTCAVPATATVSGATAVTAQLTVATTAPTTTAVLGLGLGAGGVFLAGLACFAVPRRRWSVFAMALIVLATAGSFGCGESSANTHTGGTTTGGTSAGSYTVTVNGTDAATGKLTSSTAVTVTVN